MVKVSELDRLVEIVEKKAGIPRDKAKMVVSEVLSFIKDELPVPIDNEIDAILSLDSESQKESREAGLFGMP